MPAGSGKVSLPVELELAVGRSLRNQLETYLLRLPSGRSGEADEVEGTGIYEQRRIPVAGKGRHREEIAGVHRQRVVRLILEDPTGRSVAPNDLQRLPLGHRQDHLAAPVVGGRQVDPGVGVAVVEGVEAPAQADPDVEGHQREVETVFVEERRIAPGAQLHEQALEEALWKTLLPCIGAGTAGVVQGLGPRRRLRLQRGVVGEEGACRLGEDAADVQEAQPSAPDEGLRLPYEDLGVGADARWRRDLDPQGLGGLTVEVEVDVGAEGHAFGGLYAHGRGVEWGDADQGRGLEGAVWDVDGVGAERGHRRGSRRGLR